MRATVNPFWQTDQRLDYHTRQFTTPYRSTVALQSFIRGHVDPSTVKQALDVASGAGANMYHLSKGFPDAQWTGVDLVREILDIGSGIMNGLDFHPQLVQGDLFNLTTHFPHDTFDLVLLLQTLSWLPTYEDALKQLLAVTKPRGTVIISSMFTDDLIDATTVVQQFSDDGEFTPLFSEPVNYNVYCYERFVSVCRTLGAKSVEAEDYLIDIDLQKPTDRRLGTFTRRLADGTRLQQTGPLFLPWKFIAITK